MRVSESTWSVDVADNGLWAEAQIRLVVHPGDPGDVLAEDGVAGFVSGLLAPSAGASPES